VIPQSLASLTHKFANIRRLIPRPQVSRVPLDHLSRYSLHATNFLCFPPKQSISALVKPTGEEDHVDIGPKDDEEFLAAMQKHAPPARGRAPLTKETQPLGSFVFATRCGLNTKTLTLYPNGMIQMEEKQKGATSIRELDCAFIEDLAYVRYTEAGIVQRLFLGGANRIEISFLNDTYHMDVNLPADQLPLAHEAVLTAALGRKPSAPIKVYEGKIGKMTIGPEFSTVETFKPSCEYRSFTHCASPAACSHNAFALCSLSVRCSLRAADDPRGDHDQDV
jgi:hypothetical protein